MKPLNLAVTFLLSAFGWFSILPIFFPFSSYAQNNKILDSLQATYKNTTNDTSQILLLSNIAFEYAKTNPDTCINIAQKALELSEKMQYQRGKGEAYYSIAIGHDYKDEYKEALEFYQKSLKIKQKLGDKKGLAKTFNRIGVIYDIQGSYPLALEYYQKSLKINEELQDKLSIASSFNNIGGIHDIQGSYDLALEFYQKSLKIKEELNDKRGIGITLNNIGVVYETLGNFDLALEFAQKSLKIKEELKDKRGIAATLNNIGSIYETQKKYDLALKYYQKNLQIREEMRDKLGQTYPLHGLAKVYQKQKLYNQSIEYAQKGLKIAQEIKALPEIKDLSQTLYTSYKLMGNYAQALSYFELAKQMNDTIFSVEKAKSIANLESRFLLEQKDKALALLVKDNELNKLAIEKQRLESLAELEQQKRIRNTFLGLSVTAFLVIILVGFGYYQKQKSNKLLAQKNDAIMLQQAEIAEKNDELSQANEELFQQQEELQMLNENLEQKNHQIEKTYLQLKITSDMLSKSINYASHIQSLILADVKLLQSFFADIFIIYRPRDVVSGDFYWFSKISATQSVFILADCTGHGVPGAFMSMLGSTLLDEAINERSLYTSPAEVLQFLHQRLHKMLKQADSENSDGMDISIAYFEKEEQATKIKFAGAKTNIYYIENNQLTILEGDKTYLGGRIPEARFTNRDFTLTSGGLLYFFSDGFPDQNNEARERLGVKKLQKLLTSIHHLPLQEQKNILETELDKHQGTSAQRDDISLVGLKL